MKDEYSSIIYIGKSKNLKNRVTSYFRGIKSHPIKVRTMVNQIVEFEYIITDTEMEALILEQTLIKKHQPRFNILLRDDKQYPFIRITLGEKFPRVYMTRRVIKDKSKYFGPYTNVDAVKKTLEVLHDIYPIRKCSRNMDRKVDRPCLNYHIGKCLGPCAYDVDEDEYRKSIDSVIKILSGSSKEIVDSLKEKMYKSSKELLYEDAAKYRNQYMAIENLMQKQKIVYEKNVNQDVINFSTDENFSCIMIFIVRGGKLIGREEYIFEGDYRGLDMDLIDGFIKQYYQNVVDFPREILIPHELSERDLLTKWISNLAEYKILVNVPIRGEKKKLIDLVKKNSDEYLSKFEGKIKSDIKKAGRIDNFLKTAIDSSASIKRIEAYDISNIYGVMAVASMVVYEDAKKKTSDYRRFKIKTVDGPDDYASMQEVIYRRFNRGIIEKGQGSVNSSFTSFPDLLLIDGGKGHVNAVSDVLKALKIDIPIAGMVKDGFHKTDKLYYDGEMIDIKSDMDVYRFIASIQEEVHRFAIEYHKNLRTKSITSSLLDEIKGIGEKRRNILLKHFGNLERIKNAEIDELQNIEGMTSKSAKAVYEHFKKGRNKNA
jgi:excinuclease ABC subunit C